MVARQPILSRPKPALTADTWLLAAADCLICCQPIGFDRPFYQLHEGLAHTDCFDEKSQGDY
jgi:hypothetical protein